MKCMTDIFFSERINSDPKYVFFSSLFSKIYKTENSFCFLGCMLWLVILFLQTSNETIYNNVYLEAG